MIISRLNSALNSSILSYALRFHTNTLKIDDDEKILILANRHKIMRQVVQMDNSQ